MWDLFWWWLAAEVLGLLALPLAAVLCANLPDRGWGLARPLGLLVVGWLIWLPLTLIPAFPYSRAWIAATVVLFGVGNAALLRLGPVRVALRDLLARERVYLVVGEGVFAGALALMGWERSFTPGVVDTEKFMDVAFLSSIWRAPHLPPPDPWLAGEPINYYYFGHFLMATLAKLIGTPPSVAFNTSVALIFALTAAAVFALAANLAAAARAPTAGALDRGVAVGLVSAIAVLVLGNLNAAQVWWQGAVTLATHPPRLLASPWAWWTQRALWPQFDWWSPSRVVPNTINEFPSFSFVLADLHAHVLALPFAVLALGVALNLLLARGAGLRAFGAGVAGMLALGGSGLVLGALYAINGWDLPTYLGLALLALGIQQWIEHGRRWSRLFGLNMAAAGIMLAALAFLLFIPFYRGYTAPGTGIGLVPASAASPIGDEIAIIGLPLFIAGTLLLARLISTARAIVLPVPITTSPLPDPHGSGPAGEVSRLLPVLLVVAPMALLLLWTLGSHGAGGWTIWWALLIVAACAALVLRQLLPAANGAGADVDAGPRWVGRAEIFLWCLVGTAAALIAVSERVYLRDVFDGSPSFRMNTVFKLYYQVWLLLGVATGPALAALLDQARDQLAWLAPARLAVTTRARARPVHTRLAPASDVAGVALGVAGLASASTSGRSAPGGTGASTTAAGTGGPVVRPRGHTAPAHARDAVGEGTARSMAHPGARPGTSPIGLASLRWIGAGGTLVWAAVLVVLLGAASVYPILGASARTQNFSLPRSLDGTAYMAADPLNQGDAAAIAWLNDPAHVAGDPTILEAYGDEYSHFDRVSAFTGLPTVLGWVGHEIQWRATWLAQPGHTGELEQRQRDVDLMYTSSDPGVVRSLLARYHIRYVYVGACERQKYPRINLDRFGGFLRAVYRSTEVTIYVVR